MPKFKALLVDCSFMAISRTRAWQLYFTTFELKKPETKYFIVFNSKLALSKANAKQIKKSCWENPSSYNI